MDARILVSLIIVVIAILCGVWSFIKLPNKIKINNVKEWLKIAVVEAEKNLGSGTGQLKLRQVYNLAITKFPWIGQLIKFETFSEWVDEALVWMRDELSKNDAIKNYIE